MKCSATTESVLAVSFSEESSDETGPPWSRASGIWSKAEMAAVEKSVVGARPLQIANFSFEDSRRWSSVSWDLKAQCRDRFRTRSVFGNKDKSNEVPRMSMDYFFMSQEDEKTSANPIMVMVDERTGEKYARAVGDRGMSNDQAHGVAHQGHAERAEGV